MSDPRANLRPPWKPGQSGNPKGTNQFTYRQDFDDAMGRLIQGDIAPELLAFIPDDIRPLVSGPPPEWLGEDRWTVAGVLRLIQVIESLRSGDARDKSLERLWPKVSHHELILPGIDEGGLGDALASAAKSRRSNGHDQDADQGANGSGA